MAEASRPGERLRRAFDSADRKRRYTRWLFATIADRYDLVTRVLSFGCDQGWKRRLMALAGARPGVRVLDLACGTGDLAHLAAGRGALCVGLDFTPRMLQLARARQYPGTVHWVAGDMGQLPLRSATFDLVTTGYGLRNVPDLPAALAEIHRVLRPAGRLCSLDFDRPELPIVRAVYLGYLTLVGSALGLALHGDADTYRYIAASIRRYPGARGVAALMRQAGFRDIRHLPVFGGLMAMHVAERD